MEKEELDERVDYRTMYNLLAGAVEKAIRLLIEAQQKSEDILLQEEDDPSS